MSWLLDRLTVCRPEVIGGDVAEAVSRRSAIDMSRSEGSPRLLCRHGDRGAATMTEPMTNRNRWLALVIVCLGYLMIVLDVTIVGVALPSIRENLGFSESSLAWVANAYLLTFGGFLLLAGRLGDLFGHRRLFLIGIVLFTLASLGCGLATSQVTLIGCRALQGFG